MVKKFQCKACKSVVVIDTTDSGTVSCSCGSLKVTNGGISEGTGVDITGKLLAG